MIPRASISLILAIVPWCGASAQFLFEAPRVWTEGGTILAVGDLDNDGDPDLATQTGSQLIPYLNDGTGTFTAGPAQALDPGSSLGAEPARLADIDGDSRLDLVMFNASAMHVYLGTASGGFLPVTVAPVPVAVAAFDLGDMNQDGRVDIAICSTSAKRVGWVFHDGVSFQTTTFPAVADFCAEVAALDYTNDGAADMIATLSDLNQILLVPTVAGQPAPAGTVVVGSAFSKHGGPLAGDLDGDGDEDLVVLYNDSSDLEIVTLENTPAGLVVGALLELSDVGYEVSADGGVLADWDGDGDLDIATQTLLALAGQARRRAFLIENTSGPGGLSYAGLFESPISGLGWIGGVADLDGDGHNDVATSNTLTRGDGTFAGFPMKPDFSAGTTSVIVDFDGDGDLDVRESTSVSWNDATGALRFDGDIFPLPAIAGHEFRAGVHADFDGDGIPDAMVEEWLPGISVFVPDVFVKMVFLKGDGTGAYQIAGAPVSLGVQLAAPVVGDYDGDGDQDLLTQATPGGLPAAIWRNSGNGVFPFTLPAPAGIVEDQGDVDNDGDIDLLSRSGNTLFVHRNQGGGVFASANVLSQDILDAGSRLLDLNADGALDIVAHTSASSTFGGTTHTLQLIENTGSGVYLAPIAMDLSGLESDAYGVADVDGDGVTDLLGSSTANEGAWTEDTAYGRVYFWRRVGAGLLYAAPKIFIGHRPAAFADMDGDGDIDILGTTLLDSLTFDGPSAGLIRQFGEGTPGTGGAVPLIGSHGPARAGSSSYELRLVHGLGGGAALLALGSQVIDLANAPVFGAHFYVGNLIFTLPLVLPGPVGVAGQGGFVLPAPIAPTLVGVRVVHQSLHADAHAKWGVSTSNGLEVVFGG